MSDNAIPIATPRDETRIYFDGGSAFGSPQARPATTPATDRTWDDDQLEAAAHALADGQDLHQDVRAALCARFVDLLQDENIREAGLQAATVRAQDAERRAREAGLQLEQLAAAVTRAQDAERQLAGEQKAHRGTQFAREIADDLYVTEMAERVRIAGLHAGVSAQLAAVQHQLAQVSLENLHLRHELRGTTPVSVEIALATDERFDASDTQVMAIEDLSAEEIRAFGAEVGRG